MTRKHLFTSAIVLLGVGVGLVLVIPELTHQLLSLIGLDGWANHTTGLSMAWGPAVMRLQERRDKDTARMKVLAAIVESRAWTSQEKAEFNQLKSGLDSLADVIDAAKQEEVNAARSALGAGSVTFRSFSSLRSFDHSDADPMRGFSHQGDYLQAVANVPFQRKTGITIDQRLTPLAAVPSTAANEGSGVDGGFLVPPELSHSIFSLGLQEDSLLPWTSEIQLGGNSMTFPKDESTPWGTTGPQVTWQAEMTQASPTKPVLTGMNLRLKKLVGLVPITSELLEDAVALGQWLPEKLGLAIRWKSNDAVLFGSGAGVPLGAFNSGAVVTVAKDTGQVSNTLSVTNLANMIARLPPGSYSRSVWVVNNDVMPALLTLTLGNTPVMMPIAGTQGALQAALSWQLLGRPVLFSQHANTFSAQGDVMLMDLSYYQTVTKAGGIQFATSMHLYFDADAMAFRVTFRLDGAPKLTKTIAPAKGSNAMSPFVQLGAR